MTSPALRWSDAWLLMAIWYASGRSPAPLTHVLAAADLINHATPTYEEIASGLFRLEEAGFIRRVGESLSFRCAPAMRTRIRRIVARSATLYDAWKDLEVALKAAPWIPGEPMPHPDNTHAYAPLTEAAFREALGDYLNPRRRRRAKSG